MTSIQPIEPSTTLIPEKNRTKTLTVGIITAIFVIAAPMIIGAAGGNYWVRVLDFAMLYVMLALGLNVVVGFAGLLDLGYVAFYAIGAYVAALLSSPHLTTQFEWIAHLFPGLTCIRSIIVPMRDGGCRDCLASCSARRPASAWRLSRDRDHGFGEIVRIFMNNPRPSGEHHQWSEGDHGIDPVTSGFQPRANPLAVRLAVPVTVYCTTTCL